VKNLIIILIVLVSGALAEIKLQAQAGGQGIGGGLGLGMDVIPLVMKAGVEFQSNQTPEISQKGTKDGISYDGSYKLASTSYGGYLAFSFPGVSMIPVVGIFGNPVIHAGALNGKVTPKIDSVGGMPIFGDTTGLIDGDVNISGSYIRLGLPFYLGPLFLEPSAGSQTIKVQGLSTYTVPDAQIALGISF
jgi:hypothetical protein